MNVRIFNKETVYKVISDITLIFFKAIGKAQQQTVTNLGNWSHLLNWQYGTIGGAIFTTATLCEGSYGLFPIVKAQRIYN